MIDLRAEVNSWWLITGTVGKENKHMARNKPINKKDLKEIKVFLI
jgi:hypothetical protein